MSTSSAKTLQAVIGPPQYGGAFASDDAGPLPFVLPGETVAVAPQDVPGVQRRADLIEVRKPSAVRVDPACVHFGVCGGCHYQHANYLSQLNLKREILADIFARARLAGLPETQSHHAEPWGYRNRIRLRVQSSAETGEPLRVGYSLPGSNDFLPIRMCPIAAPLLWRAAETLLRLAAEDPLTRRWLAAASELELFCLPDESRLQLTLFLREIQPAHRDTASFPAFCERLRSELPELAGAGARFDPELNRRVRLTWGGAAWGAAGLAYPAAGRSYWVSRGAFFQVNRFLVDRLVALVCEGGEGAIAWDLFAGVGLFTRALAESFGRVVAVEGAEAAAADLAAAANSRKGPPAFEAVRSSTLEFLRARELQRERPDLVVLDPPRAGLGSEGAAILARIAAPRIVYVSCDPVTLARDLAILTRDAYRIDAVDLIDLFPQTYHLETVVHLSRR